jgi:molybdopterin-containing oxidoreductase family iron-sulfur binding subunit
MPRGMGTVESCTMCAHLVDEGRIPACVEACNNADLGAMTFGDLNDPNSEISKKAAQFMTTKIREDLGLNPGILYKGI